MRWLLVSLLTVGWWVESVQAETTVIYRKSDRLVVGRANPPQPIELELQNILNSSLGGTLDDYGTAPLAVIPQGHFPIILPDGTASTEPYPEREEPVEIPIESFGAGAAGALAALGGRGLVLRVRKKRGTT